MVSTIRTTIITTAVMCCQSTVSLWLIVGGETEYLLSRVVEVCHDGNAPSTLQSP